MERISAGIKGIDEMIQGGLPKGSVVGISGPPGVGKSIFALHFILEGARNGEKGVYISLEEPRSNIDKMIKGFSFSKEFYDLEEKGLIVIRCFNYSEYEKISLDLLEKVQEDKKIKRLVIDSFNCFFDSLESNSLEEIHFNVRRMINSSFSYLRKNNLNVLLVLEKHENSLLNFDYNIPYLVDGLVRLDYLDLGIVERRLFIPKMRWTNQYKESRGYEISSEGITMLEAEE
jgi:KaiC/GvpD/RAD55 family RecA-like ATPase